MTGRDDPTAAIIAEFRAHHGQVGGRFAGAPLLLLHTVGARTGQARVNPMMYLADGGRYVVFATKAGADTHPAWYYNLLAHPDTVIEVGDRTVPVHAAATHGAEREALYSRQASRYPAFARYQAGTARVIPVVALRPTGHNPLVDEHGVA
jgi:deazaflavin-dependent oxidoreductase (nitroreductase family)